MSITSPVPDEEGVAFTAVGESCFYCGEPTPDPAIHWMGSPRRSRRADTRRARELEAILPELGPLRPARHLFLHPDCAVKLMVRLMRDVHELKNPSYYERRRNRVPR